MRKTRSSFLECGALTALLIINLALMTGPAFAQYDLVRADFQTTNGEHVHDDTRYTDDFVCASEVFDYVDNEDTECAPTGSADNVNSDSSGGGRWHFNTHVGGDSNRDITIDFSAPKDGSTVTPADGSHCDLLNDHLESLGLECDCNSPCNVSVWIHADRLFKKGASRQALGRFDVVVDGYSGPALRIDYVDPLYICAMNGEHSKDRNWRRLTSRACAGTDDVSEAEVVIPPVGGVGQNIVLGRWDLPIEIWAQRIDLPGDDGGTEPPSCSLGQKGDSCTNNSDCCSQSCKGKSGAKTCK
jgi:hypothetical protein